MYQTLLTPGLSLQSGIGYLQAESDTCTCTILVCDWQSLVPILVYSGQSLVPYLSRVDLVWYHTCLGWTDSDTYTGQSLIYMYIPA